MNNRFLNAASALEHEINKAVSDGRATVECTLDAMRGIISIIRDQDFLIEVQGTQIVDLKRGLNDAHDALEPFAEVHEFFSSASEGFHEDNEIDDQGLIKFKDCTKAWEILSAYGDE